MYRRVKSNNDNNNMVDSMPQRRRLNEDKKDFQFIINDKEGTWTYTTPLNGLKGTSSDKNKNSKATQAVLTRQAKLTSTEFGNDDIDDITGRHRPHHHNRHHYQQRRYEQEKQYGQQSRLREQKLIRPVQQELYNGNSNKRMNNNNNNNTQHEYSQPWVINPHNDDIYNDNHKHSTYHDNNMLANRYRQPHTQTQTQTQTRPLPKHHNKQTGTNCQNLAYEQHYQQYFSYYYNTNKYLNNKHEDQEDVPQKRGQEKEQNRRKLPKSPKTEWAMPSIEDSPPNEIDSINRSTTTQNDHQYQHLNKNVLREKTLHSNNNNNNKGVGGAVGNRVGANATSDAENRSNSKSNLRLNGRNTNDMKASGDFTGSLRNNFERTTTPLHSRLENGKQKTIERIRTLMESTKSTYVPTNSNTNPSTPAHSHRLEGGRDENIHHMTQHLKPVSHNTQIEDKAQPVKLPSTPSKQKVLKKPSPPSPRNHRVLLYNNQSPRLSRLAGSHTRIHMPLRSQINQESPLIGQTIQSGNVLATKVHIVKSMSPIKATNVQSNLNKRHIDDDLDDIDDIDDDFENGNNENDLDKDPSSDGGSDVSDVTTESEDYRSFAYNLTHTIEHVDSKQSLLSIPEESLTNPPNLLIPSLFPNVPPYLSFSSNTQKGPDIPADLHRVLKWRVTAIMPRVVRCVLANSGMRLLKKTNDWMGIWGKHMKSPYFKSIRPYQKINHLPGSFRIGRKDSCWKNLVKFMAKHGKKDFGFMPRTYILPNDLNQLRKKWPKYAQKNVKWIIKPPASARGAGIRVIDRWAQIPKRKPLIVQKYIERPLLINGSKFDLRLYVLVTSIDPLRVYMYHNGLARFASVKYSDKSDSLHDRCMHLTNYSINKLSSNYSKNEDVNACHGHKWTIKSLWSYLATRGVRIECLWEALRNLVLRTILAGENSINNMIKTNMESKYSCYELFGFDVLLDADLVPWLLEVNISPSLHSELPLDSYVKAPLVQSVLNAALYNVPPKIPEDRQREIAAEMCLPTTTICYDKRLYINYLSRREKLKHNTFTRKTIEDREEYINTILQRLTPDDVRCLIVAEDELERSKPLERIFPTADTHKYLKYTETPRYYNRLLDAWETRYSNNRDEGIALLRKLCEENYHLQVPPMPVKKDSSDELEDLSVVDVGDTPSFFFP